MSGESEMVQINLQVGVGQESGPTKLDQTTRQLRDELKGQVESVQLASSGVALKGARIADPVTIGALALVVLPTAVPALIKFLQSWCLRAEGRTVEIEIQRAKNRLVRVKVSGDITSEKLRDIIDSVTND